VHSTEWGFSLPATVLVTPLIYHVSAFLAVLFLKNDPPQTRSLSAIHTHLTGVKCLLQDCQLQGEVKFRWANVSLILGPKDHTLPDCDILTVEGRA
jgi:hypothetical protein